MEDRSKHIDDLFREGLSDYQELPSTDVWQSLEQRLPAVKQPSKRWMWWIVLAALLATLSYYIINKAAEKKTNENKPNQELKTEPVNNTHSSTSTETTKEKVTSTSKKTGETKLDVKKENNIHSSIQAQKTTTNTINPSITIATASKNNNADIENQNSKTDKTVAAKNHSNAINNGWKKHTTTTNKTGKETSNKNDDNTLTNSDDNVAADKTTKNDKALTNNKASVANNYSSNNSSSTKNNVATKQATSKNNKNSNNKIASDNNTTTNSNNNIATTKNKSTHSSKTKTNKTATTNNNNKQRPIKEDKNSTAKTQSSLDNKTHKDKQASQKSPTNQVANNKKIVKNKKQNTNNKLAANKKNAEQDQPIKTTKKKNTDANTDESSRKELDIVSSGSGKNELNITPAKDGKKKEYDVKPAPFKKPKPIDVKPATSNKNSNLIINGVSWKKKNIDPLAPAKEPQKKTYEVTNTGVKIITPDDDEQQVEEQQTPPVSAAEPVETAKETEKPEEVLLATGSKPSPVTTPTQGGGGGATEPNVPLRNFSNKLKFEGGIKAGYERGTNAFTNGSMIVSPFLQWNISKSFAIMLQPGFRYNQLSRTDIFDMTKAYHQINAATLDTANKYVLDTTGGVLSIQRNYIYKNFYDSIVVKNALKTKNYWEIEIPIMLRFNAATNLAVFGGLSLTLGNLIQIQETRTTISGLQRYDSLSFAAVSPNSPPPQVASPNNYFTYNTADISTAPPPNNSQNPATNPPRLGLMFGFSYELQNRIMVDVMVKKNISDMKYIPNEDIRKIYTQPYFRIMVGYKLFNNDKDKTVKNSGGL